MTLPDMPLRALHILVADGSLLNRKMLSAMLERRGHHVCAVPDGHDVLQELLRDRFDVVVLDTGMTGMDGVQTVHAIRASVTDRVDASIPVVALASLHAEEDRARYVQAGMDAVLPRPVRINALLRTVHDVMAAKGRDAVARAGEPPAQPKQGALRPFGIVRDEYGLEADDINALYALMRDTLPREYAALRVAVREGWLAEAADMAHSLAGSSLDILVDGPALLAREIEHAARNGDAAEARALCDELEPQILHVLGQLVSFT